MSIPEEALSEILYAALKAATEGTLTDKDRIFVYRLALTVAADEFYRIESGANGSVEPAVLLLIQQLTSLCADDFDPSRILTNAPQEPDAGPSEPASA